ncbi:thiamine-monophosphate kinase [Planctomycetota bacterium]
MSHGEDQLVAWLADHSPVGSDRCPVGIGDDMAVVQSGPKDQICVTTDMLLEGIHFDLSQATLEQVGYKAMAVSLSDCAAMATVPWAAVVSVGLPGAFGVTEVRHLHKGIMQGAKAFDCALVGGDTTRWYSNAGLVLNVAMLSVPGKISPVTRSGAQIGDRLCVTGQLGGSRAGHHLNFIPRVKEAQILTESVSINAMMDLSDGLSTDLARLCQASGVGAVVGADDIPLSPAALSCADPLAAGLHDGEDFELLFTLAPEAYQKLKRIWQMDVPIVAIGTVIADQKVWLRDAGGQQKLLVARGFDHFQTMEGI